MIASSTKVLPASVERYTCSDEFGPSTWDLAVRCTSQSAPFQLIRSVFSLCWQMALRHSLLVTSSPATRTCASASQLGPGVAGDEQPASSTSRLRLRMREHPVDDV